MKAFTDLEQSKKLAEILPIESADMYYYTVNGDWEWYETPNVIERSDDLEEHAMPAWSLAALFEGVLPLEAEIHKQTDGHKMYYYVEAYIPPRRKGKAIYLSTVRYENLIDACIEMIFTLKQRDLL